MKLYQPAKNNVILLFNSILESSDQIGHINMLKIRLFHQFVQEKEFIWKFCNMIGWEDFGLYIRNKIFPKGFVQEQSK